VKRGNLLAVCRAQTNTATVSDSDQFDPNTANNSAAATGPAIRGFAALAVP
jgi:hypothetical protein